MAKAIADASDLTWRGIIERDITKLGQGLHDTMLAWEGKSHIRMNIILYELLGSLTR